MSRWLAAICAVRSSQLPSNVARPTVPTGPTTSGTFPAASWVANVCEAILLSTICNVRYTFDCDLLNWSITRFWTSICLGSAPVPSPTYHLTTVRPPAADGSNVSTATGVGVGGIVVCAHVLETVSARTSSVAPQVSSVRLSIWDPPSFFLFFNQLSGYGEKCGPPLTRTDPPFG